MHLYFIGRGTKKYLRRFEEDLANQQIIYEGGKWQFLGLREVKLYELAFPKKAVREVVGLLGHSQSIGKWEKYKLLLKKALGLKNVPKANPKQQEIPHLHVGIHTIGIKEDRDNEDGSEHI